jgi:hypothetical protein
MNHDNIDVYREIVPLDKGEGMFNSSTIPCMNIVEIISATTQTSLSMSFLVRDDEIIRFSVIGLVS